jgi:hypothetical protein
MICIVCGVDDVVRVVGFLSLPNPNLTSIETDDVSRGALIFALVISISSETDILNESAVDASQTCASRSDRDPSHLPPVF